MYARVLQFTLQNPPDLRTTMITCDLRLRQNGPAPFGSARQQQCVSLWYHPVALLFGEDYRVQAVGRLYPKSESSGFVPSPYALNQFQQTNTNKLTLTQIISNELTQVTVSVHS